MPERQNNVDHEVTAGFGDEWSRIDQSALDASEKARIFEDYFSIFPWLSLPEESVGADIGCGSGRWATLVAPRVGKLHCVDASDAALNVARKNLVNYRNVEFSHAEVGSLPFEPGTLDFVYSLGVLHHVPDTAAGIRSCVDVLKPGAPLLLYLYYRFDNRPNWFRWLWKLSEFLRSTISRLPYGTRFIASQLVAACIYWPLARLCRLLRACGVTTTHLPLSFYADKSYYVMRTDALDRFGTRLEQRFTRPEIEDLMKAAGLTSIRFSDRPPHWCAVGVKRQGTT